jgi:hypothetical protein
MNNEVKGYQKNNPNFKIKIPLKNFKNRENRGNRGIGFNNKLKI